MTPTSSSFDFQCPFCKSFRAPGFSHSDFAFLIYYSDLHTLCPIARVRLMTGIHSSDIVQVHYRSSCGTNVVHINFSLTFHLCDVASIPIVENKYDPWCRLWLLGLRLALHSGIRLRISHCSWLIIISRIIFLINVINLYPFQPAYHSLSVLKHSAGFYAHILLPCCKPAAT